jgi:GNAT superfamily N-acetyltransferase
MQDFKLARITTFRDFNTNRLIRNECSVFLTNNTKSIGLLEEFRFWNKTRNSEEVHLFLGYNEGNYPIAYGLIKKDESSIPWLSGGLRLNYRGQGYGKLLFQALCDYSEIHWNLPAHLEVRQFNIRAHKLYINLGFKEVTRESRKIFERSEVIITMQYAKSEVINGKENKDNLQ